MARPLFGAKTNQTCHQTPNPYRETVPLNGTVNLKQIYKNIYFQGLLFKNAEEVETENLPTMPPSSPRYILPKTPSPISWMKRTALMGNSRARTFGFMFGPKKE